MLASLLLSLAVLGAHAATTVDLAPSDVVFSPGWTNETTRDGANSFLQAGEFLCAMTASLPPAASSVTYFGFPSPGAQYGYTVDCVKDCVVTRANGIDNDDDSASSEVFSVSDLDPSVNHTLRVYNLGTDDTKINFDRLSVLVEDNADASQDSNAGITSPVRTNAPSSTTTAIRSTTPASWRVQSPSASSGSGPNPSSKNTANPDASSTTSNTDSSSPASPSTTSGTDGSSNGAASSSSGGSSVSIRLVAGLTIFAVVVTAGVLVLLFLCLRRRRRERRAYTTSAVSGSGRQPPSPTASIIPIMAPPPPHMSMRVSSGFPNPFADPDPASEPVAMFPSPYAVPQMSQLPPPAPVPFVSPMAAVMQQRRQRSDSVNRSASPSSSAPTIPLPQLPAGARLRDGGEGSQFGGYGYGGRSDSPASSDNTQNNGLWITRTPVKSHFSFAV